jgi:hypothetical protein
LNYAKRQAAVCVGAPDGGTVAKLRRYTDNGRGRWICPVGLEKSTAQDLFEIQKITNNSSAERKNTVKLNVTEGNVYTEIEAVWRCTHSFFVTACPLLFPQRITPVLCLAAYNYSSAATQQLAVKIFSS